MEKESCEEKNNNIQKSFEEATGEIEYQFTNDYMFRAVLQRNEYVLKGLICALLRLREDEIMSIRILNPIILGQAIEDKEFILDIEIMLNNYMIINLEMQVNSVTGWEERSLSYLCRSFDSLHKGEEYEIAGPAIHVGILDYTPYADAPEFYATYKMLNVKNHRVYSDKFMLNMLSLTQIECATEDDKQYKLDVWAKIFKAKTWEDLRMIAKASHDESIKAATEALYVLNSDRTILDQCRARQDYENLHRRIDRRMKELESQNETLTSRNETLTSQVDRYRKLLAEHNIPYEE